MMNKGKNLFFWVVLLVSLGLAYDFFYDNVASSSSSIPISELLDKSKELDLAKILELYQEVQAGKEVKLLNNMISIQKSETKQ